MVTHPGTVFGHSPNETSAPVPHPQKREMVANSLRLSCQRTRSLPVHGYSYLNNLIDCDTHTLAANCGPCTKNRPIAPC